MLKYIQPEAFTSKRHNAFITKGFSHFYGLDVIPLPRLAFKHFFF